MRPLLTIAIPTYNRVEKLKGALQRIEAECISNRIELIISDNASNDGTEDFCETYVRDHLFAKYYRNASNLGYSGNFINCFEKATGQYVWLLSDDDYLCENAISSVLVCINRRPNIIKLGAVSKNAKAKGGEILEFREKETYFEKIGMGCTFISGIVFNTDIIREIEKDTYREDPLILGYVLETISRDGVYLINETTCVKSSSNEKVSYDVYKYWAYQYPYDMERVGARCGYSSQFIKKNSYIALNNQIFEFVVKYRRTCDYRKWDSKYVWKYVNNYPDLRIWYSLAVKSPLIFLPIIRYAHIFYRKVIKR